jgi:catechol 2,3-dioxygenase-like lactoylglutathione lyase family enzyme
MAHITELATVVVPVADQDRALAFYSGTLGLEPTADFTYADGARWVEVRPREGTSRLSLATGRPVGIETGLALVTTDLEADHAALAAARVDVDPILRAGDPPVRWAGTVLAGIPSMFLLRDPDGNSLLLIEQV